MSLHSLSRRGTSGRWNVSELTRTGLLEPFNCQHSVSISALLYSTCLLVFLLQFFGGSVLLLCVVYIRIFSQCKFILRASPVFFSLHFSWYPVLAPVPAYSLFTFSVCLFISLAIAFTSPQSLLIPVSKYPVSFFFCLFQL